MLHALQDASHKTRKDGCLTAAKEPKVSAAPSSQPSASNLAAVVPAEPSANPGISIVEPAASVASDRQDGKEAEVKTRPAPKQKAWSDAPTWRLRQNKQRKLVAVNKAISQCENACQNFSNVENFSRMRLETVNRELASVTALVDSPDLSLVTKDPDTWKSDREGVKKKDALLAGKTKLSAIQQALESYHSADQADDGSALSSPGTLAACIWKCESLQVACPVIMKQAALERYVLAAAESGDDDEVALLLNAKAKSGKRARKMAIVDVVEDASEDNLAEVQSQLITAVMGRDIVDGVLRRFGHGVLEQGHQRQYQVVVQGHRGSVVHVECSHRVEQGHGHKRHCAVGYWISRVSWMCPPTSWSGISTPRTSAPPCSRSLPKTR